MYINFFIKVIEFSFIHIYRQILSMVKVIPIGRDCGCTTRLTFEVTSGLLGWMSFLYSWSVVRAQTNQCNARQIFILSCYWFFVTCEGFAPCFLLRLTVRFGQASMIVIYKVVGHNSAFAIYVYNSKDSGFYT